MAMTLHTPVPAGNERYDPDLALEVLADPISAIGLGPDDLRALGHGPEGANGSTFDLTGFGLRMVAIVNAVSQLHARTATATWESSLGHPVRGITNGVHVPTWQAEPVRTAMSRTAPLAVPDRQLWDAHAEQKPGAL